MTSKSKKLVAVVHDSTGDGDSAYYCPNSQVPYKKGMTLQDIRKTYFDKMMEKEINNPFFCEQSAREDADGISGAWILDERGERACSAVWNSNHGNDSETYACNRAAKAVAAEICIKEIKK